MEDSYTVHKRRKANAAASRKCDKSPESVVKSAEEETVENSKLQIGENTDDEDEARRRRMEQMAEDTERMEEEVIKEHEEQTIVAPELDLDDKNVIEIQDSNEPKEQQVELNKIVKKKSNKTKSSSSVKNRRSSDTSDIDEWNDQTKESKRNRSPGIDTTTGKKLKMKKLSSKGKERTNKSQVNLKEKEIVAEATILKKQKRRKNDTTWEFKDSRCLSETRKQIIPISNETLIEDFNRAQRQYLMREKSILEADPLDLAEEATHDGLRKRTRKMSLERECEDNIETEEEPLETNSWFSWFRLNIFRKKKIDEIEEKIETIEKKVTFVDFLRALKDIVSEFQAFIEQNPDQVQTMRILRNSCSTELILIIIYCGLGAFVFRFTEGAFETFYKCGVKRVKRDFLDSLWNYSHNLKEEEWKSMARRKLMEFEEQLHEAHEAGVHSYSGQKSWSFLNAVVYCLTVITTIGYGHIAPSTTTGRAITIIYAIFGIPLFLIILADFGKLFTRGMKFLWAFVRRLYYTGSCRQVRRTVPVQEVMKGVQLVYDFATFRRPSQMNPEEIEEIQKQHNQGLEGSGYQAQTVLNLDGNMPGTPGTPAMSAFDIDDEFNLPISVAIFILLGYIIVGATLYYLWEDWGFFESFYFVFISMSTIGFGDYVPKHPIYMMCSIIYLVFGLALTSMCINVVQVMLSDSFKQATQKIGTTIGFEVAEDDGTMKPEPSQPVQVDSACNKMNESETDEKVAPKAKQEDVDL